MEKTGAKQMSMKIPKQLKQNPPPPFSGCNGVQLTEKWRRVLTISMRSSQWRPDNFRTRDNTVRFLVPFTFPKLRIEPFVALGIKFSETEENKIHWLANKPPNLTTAFDSSMVVSPSGLGPSDQTLTTANVLPLRGLVLCSAGDG